MSRKISIQNLTDPEIEKINKELQIKIEPSKYAFGAAPTYIFPFDFKDNIAYVPFSYSNKFPLPDTKLKTKAKFQGSLRPHQKKVRKEAIDIMNKRNAVIIAAFPGFGKCLAIDTPIIMYDGTIKMVQHILPGELIMGDDSTPRNVLSTCKGVEQMYEIIPSKGESYTVNKSHILSLKISQHKNITLKNKKYILNYFDTNTLKPSYKIFKTEEEAILYKDSISEEDIVDITVKDYLQLSKSVKEKLKGYKVPVEFSSKTVELDPYFLGLWLGSRSEKILDLHINNSEIKEYLEKYAETEGLTMTIHKSKNNIDTLVIGKHQSPNKLLEIIKKMDNRYIPIVYKCNDRTVRLKLLAGLIDYSGCYKDFGYEIVQQVKTLADDVLYLSRSLGFASSLEIIQEENKYSYKISIYGGGLEKIPVLISTKKFRKPTKDHLTTEITVVPKKVDTYYGFEIDGNHRFLLGDFTVTHNTCTAINIATKIKLKTLIITHRIILVNQWKSALKKFCPDSMVQILTANSRMKEAEFYIINAINVPKHPREFYKDIYMIIVDECHIIMSEVLSKCMLSICPRYLLGLSATPYRYDGLNILLDLYFGKQKVIRKLYKKHTAFLLETKFVPKVELSKTGRVNWGVVIDSQAMNTDRNEMIIRLVKFFYDRVFLILCKRVAQGNYLVDRLKEENENVTSLIGKQQSYEQSSRILVGTTGKCSVGFDHPRLNTLLLASDVQDYYIQTLGRVFRREDSEPIIIDIVDKNGLLKKHFKTRRSVYIEHGGQVKNFHETFPDFK